MWHVSNELGCHNGRCYSELSAQGFRRWLRERYTDLEILNRAWATDFWSQRYGSWEEIKPPRIAPSFSNPTQQLDFARFSSDALREQLRAEAEVLRRHTPDVPVTAKCPRLFKVVGVGRVVSCRVEAVVPFAMEAVAGEDPLCFQGFHLLVADLDAGGVGPGVQLSVDLQPAACGGSGDGLHDHVMAGQGSPAPVHAGVGEEPVLDLVPLGRARR